MTMDYALAGLIATAASLAVSWLFRSPKEQADELQRRMATLEGQLNAMSRDYAGNHGRHEQALTTLTAAIERLTNRFDAYMGSGNGRGGR